MKFEIFRKKEEQVRVNCFDIIAIDEVNKICRLEVKTISGSRSKMVEKLTEARKVLLKFELLCAAGYNVQVVEKNSKMPNEYIISNKSLYEYLWNIQDFNDTIFGSRGM